MTGHRNDTSGDTAFAMAALGALRLVDAACGYTLLGSQPLGFTAFGITRDRTLACRPVVSPEVRAETKRFRVITGATRQPVPSWLLAHLDVHVDEDWTMLGFDSSGRRHWWAVDAASHPGFIARFLDTATLYQPGDPLRVNLAR